MHLIEAIILAIIEGITEYLPVSSTGHMIIASSFMRIATDDFTKLFTIVIQLGAILAVLVLYWKRFFQSLDFYLKLLVAFIPAVILGLLLNDIIDDLLESPITVAISLIIGGFILLKVDDWFKANEVFDKRNPTAHTEISYLTALKIGFFQCLAMIPGTSRSGASIVGGMTQKINRKTAAEFSFFLAVPTMLGATAKKTYDYYKAGFMISSEQINYLIIGNIVAFIVALIAIKSFIDYLSKKGFKLFGYYRIVLGFTLLIIHFFIYKLSI
ncbi:undecaprenyl-diphosphate phosphatase [Tenacibaculum maritimum]|uniref:Undecaprenyl-diphosphatase n=1 Tax=Tenacibaculum maritimum NCIMB 2154 TaxID=1349785 RepID=A0A2H1E7F0_9FLAO|nr:undecaprenyl-diphosphate phosphatase [Tenacibaculum maritimum]MCD9561902.1 undecaprenyl-diphosphate phosphatase [Tenacibaculum maritimum]MCD9564984.1 undecaprenyl-diphosphate phosphatase [Tenacibaculum maritimum]MCD9578957.1 undecaprenyl-diphosphate phosphatase [Tenacibaculum maritimum]MCD9580869.1 undecaprenyl-diphosphate phosphatase [Tenacibaculum maritimum]MCD9595811.1 undecaprenyl-diphosphate phosphatase [Tenacibaculum maritimum]